MKNKLSSLRNLLQEKLQRVILMMGFLALVAAIIEGIPHNTFFGIFTVYIPAFFMLIIISSIKKISQTFKTMVVIFLLLCLGLSELYFFGIESQGFVFFYAAVILATLILDTRSGFVTIIISLILVSIILLLHIFDFRLRAMPYQIESFEYKEWLSPVLTYLMLVVSTYTVLRMILISLITTIENKDEIGEKLIKEGHSLAVANRELEKVAFVDPVTGLYNNSKYVRDIKQIESEYAEEGCTIYQVLVELVDFYDFNIKHGIELSNTLLRHLADNLKTLENCSVYRETGARFLIQCMGNDTTIHERKINQLEEILMEPFACKDNMLQIKYRAAEICYPDDVDSPSQLISTLMMTLNDDRNRKINTIIPHNQSKIKKIQRESIMKELLARALEKGEIYTLIQPRLDTKKGLVSGGELLIRWRNKKLGLVSPEEFIPLAEKEGLIYELTLFVLDSLMMIRKEDFPGINLLTKPTISINISPLLLHSNMMNEIITRLDNMNHWAEIEFELTEGVFLGKSDMVLEEIRSIQNKKIGISIDDFGTGYSNIEYLQDVEADILKIDRRFISGIPHNLKQQNIVLAIINIAKALNLHIVAEGVEYIEQYTWLKKQGVQEIQGYLLGRPMSFEDFKDFVMDHAPESW